MNKLVPIPFYWMLTFGCTGSPIDSGTDSAHTETTDPEPDEVPEPELDWGIEEVESDPSLLNGDRIFDPSLIHHFAIEMDADSQSSLGSDPRNYAPSP